MGYWEATPDPRLAALVARFSFSTDPRPFDPARRYTIRPDGCADMIFSVAAGPRSLGERPCIGEIFGTKTRAIQVGAAAPAENIAVSFRPGVLGRLLRVPADAMTDRAVDIAEVLGREAHELKARIAAAPGLETCRRILEQFLLRRFADTPLEDTDRLCEAAVHRIVRGSGIRIASLAGDLGVGQRRLERLFRRRVGVTPKLFHRLIRFHRACERLARGADAARVALESGYSDQAHMIREFRELGGHTPGRAGR